MVREVVDRINMQIGERIGLAIDVIDWPNRLVPGIGSEPQEVINRQVGRCDIYVVLFWKRLGTPTKGHISGAVEEFERGYDAWKEDPKTQVFVYFSKRPFFPTREEMPQVRRLLDFQHQIASRGVLFYTFESIVEFERKLHDHLALFLFQWRDILKSGDEEMLLFELHDSRRFQRGLRELRDTAKTVAVVYCDLDHFTDLKDKLYERTKDQVWAMKRSHQILAHLAHTIFRTVGSHGHVFRYAGDEFAIIVPNRSVSQVIDLGERIRAAVEDEGHVEDFNITTSIGIACSQTNEGQGLRERAEEATYVSKLTGKNRVVVSPISSDDEKLIKEARDRGYS